MLSIDLCLQVTYVTCILKTSDPEKRVQWHIVVTRSDTTPYAKQNGGQFNFIFDGPHSLPDDQVVTSSPHTYLSEAYRTQPVVFISKKSQKIAAIDSENAVEKVTLQRFSLSLWYCWYDDRSGILPSVRETCNNCASIFFL